MKFNNLAQYLGALSIESATEHTWKAIIEAGYDTIEKIKTLTTSTIATIQMSGHVIGEKRAILIRESLTRNDSLLSYAKSWISSSKHTASPIPTSLKIDLSGKNIVFTGAGPLPRNQIQAQLESAGANIQSGVSKTTDLLILEDLESTSSKAQKAKSLGVKMVLYSDVF